MKSPDLFSHRYEPEVASHAGSDLEPVQLPTFSDRPKTSSGRPQSDSAATTPS